MNQGQLNSIQAGASPRGPFPPTSLSGGKASIMECHADRLATAADRLDGALDRLRGIANRLGVAVDPSSGPAPGRDAPQPVGAIHVINQRLDRMEMLVSRVDQVAASLDDIA